MYFTTNEVLDENDLHFSVELYGELVDPLVITCSIWQKDDVGICNYTLIRDRIVPERLSVGKYFIAGRLNSYSVREVGLYRINWEFQLSEDSGFLSYPYLFSIVI